MSFLSSSFSLQLSFILPTSERSYLSSEKNKLLNKTSVDSFVGGSPGLNILYMSISASALLLLGSFLRVSARKDPLSIVLVYTILNDSIFDSKSFLRIGFSISVFASNKISPVAVSTMSSARICPINSSELTFIIFDFCFEKSAATFALILLPEITSFPATSIEKSNAFPLSSSGEISRCTSLFLILISKNL